MFSKDLRQDVVLFDQLLKKFDIIFNTYKILKYIFISTKYKNIVSADIL